MRFQLPFVILPGPDNNIILGQVTLREVLGVDVMHALKRSVLRLCEVAEDDGADGENGADAERHSDAGAVRTWCEGGAHVLAESRTGSPASDGAGSEELGAEAAPRPVVCGHTIQLTVDDFSDTHEVTTPKLAEEALLDNLLLHTPCMFMERGEELRARREASRQAALVAEKQAFPSSVLIGCARYGWVHTLAPSGTR